jgi:hypothetical protein
MFTNYGRKTKQRSLQRKRSRWWLENIIAMDGGEMCRESRPMYLLIARFCENYVQCSGNCLTRWATINVSGNTMCHMWFRPDHDTRNVFAYGSILSLCLAGTETSPELTGHKNKIDELEINITLMILNGWPISIHVDNDKQGFEPRPQWSTFLTTFYLLHELSIMNADLRRMYVGKGLSLF